MFRFLSHKQDKVVNPIFIFGTGRSGSTHLQRLISLRTSVWIWGEHEGFLEPVLSGCRSFEHSEKIKRNIFDTQIFIESDANLIKCVEQNSPLLSWLNRLAPDAAKSALRDVIDSMFRSGMPQGWDEWGFKEIRYGLRNDVPDILLDIFPTATALFTFRPPRETLFSMMKSWTSQAVRQDPTQKEDLGSALKQLIAIYEKILDYFIDLRANRNRKVIFVSLESLSLSPRHFFDVLGLSSKVKSFEPLTSITNKGRSATDEHMLSLFNAIYGPHKDRLGALYQRSLELSNEDFGKA